MDLEQATASYLNWLEDTRTMSEHTLRAYAGDLATLTNQVGAATSATGLNADGLVAFIAAQRRDGLAAATIRRRASAVRGFCQWLDRTGQLTEDPWRDVDIRIRQPKRLPRPARHDSVRRLLAWLCRSAAVSRTAVPTGPFARPYQANTLVAVALMLSTGLRAGEVTTLCCEHIDLNARSVRVTGKGARERQVYLSCDWIAGLIQAQLLTCRTHRLRHQRLLFNRSGDTLTTASLRSRIRKETGSAGVCEHITPHVLRHTAATQLVDSGVDIRFIQRLLGHASLTTTEQYTHVADASLRRVVAQADVLGRVLARHDDREAQHAVGDSSPHPTADN